MDEDKRTPAEREQDLRKRLNDARLAYFEAVEKNDRLNRELGRKADLTGPDYIYRRFWSNGQVSATAKSEAREDIIRFWSGFALPYALEHSKTYWEAAREVRAIALTLWDNLEAWFDKERKTCATVADIEAMAAKKTEDSERPVEE